MASVIIRDMEVESRPEGAAMGIKERAGAGAVEADPADKAVEAIRKKSERDFRSRAH